MIEAFAISLKWFHECPNILPIKSFRAYGLILFYLNLRKKKDKMNSILYQILAFPKHFYKKYLICKHSSKNFTQPTPKDNKKEILHMFTLRSEHDEFLEDGTKVIVKGKVYEGSFTRGFFHPQEMRQFVRKPDYASDMGKLVIFIDIVNEDGKMITTFCYNSLEFNEKWSILR